ncbi:MAG: NTP transferase domain-containing protein [Desulfobacula sp.]|nr:NTP transferase domain-containing protein [Desulfobacula sp.]
MTRQIPKISAIIPAAGLSTRMHEYKPLLKLGRLTIVEHTIGIFKKCKINDIVVVTGHNHKKIEPVIQKAGARTVFNKNYKTGMLGSIKTGVKNISPGNSGFFLLPVDIPLIRPSTLNGMISNAKKNPEHIIIPEFNKEPGHPPFIPAWLVPEILKLKNDSNLGRLLLSLKKHQKKQIVHDSTILMDADTPKAYDTLKEKYKAIDIPDKNECFSIINTNIKEEKNIQAHVKMVAKTAITLARAVKAKSVKKPGKTEINTIDLDLDLIYAGALLHDIKRKEINHAKAGAQYLLSLGFPKIADIISHHMDLSLPLCADLTETQIVYFADKLCNGAMLEPDLDFSRRFKKRIKQTPQAKKMIVKRYEHTAIIQTRIENLVKKPIKSILSTLI